MRLAGHSKGMAQRHDSLKIFLSDDSPLIRTRIAAMLGAPDMTIVGQAATATASIAGILATGPDVVVLDVQLQAGTGLDVMRAVHPVAPGIAFIVFSNNAGPAYRKRYLAEGAMGFLDKSSEFDQLARVVASVSPLSPTTPSKPH